MVDNIAYHNYDTYEKGQLFINNSNSPDKETAWILDPRKSIGLLDYPLIPSINYKVLSQHAVQAYSTWTYPDGSVYWWDPYNFGKYGFNPVTLPSGTDQTWFGGGQNVTQINRYYYPGATADNTRINPPWVYAITSGNPILRGESNLYQQGTITISGVDLWNQWCNTVVKVETTPGGPQTTDIVFTIGSSSQTSATLSWDAWLLSPGRYYLYLDNCASTTNATNNAIPFDIYDPPPTITSFSPQAFQAGVQTNFTIAGLGLGLNALNGAHISFNDPRIQIVPGSLVYALDEEITGTVTVDPTTPSETATVTVTGQGIYYVGERTQATASIQVNPVVYTVTVITAPSTVSLGASQQQRFAATVMETTNIGTTIPVSQQVAWAIVSGSGTIDQTGLYTAPSSVPSTQTVTLRATSTAFPTTSATATVTLIPVGVSVSPTSVSLWGGQSKQFTSTVAGTSNTGVTWSISPSVGVISTGGLYTTPSMITSPQTVAVIATSLADPTKFATATVTLVPIGVTVTPAVASLSASQTQQFSAAVTGTSTTTVNWSISPAGVGTISSSGIYQAPSSIPNSQIVTVIAQSAVDTTKSGSASVTLNPINVAVSPATATVPQGGTQQFTTVVSGTSNTSVTWTATGGTVSGTGLYTAPAMAGTYVVTATSAADTTKFATATVTVPNVAITISPSTATVALGMAQQFTATVTGAINTNVTWSTNTSPVGLFTATTAGTFYVSATSQADSSKTATATVTVPSSFQFNEVEPNNTIAAANVVPAGNGTISGAVSSMADHDYFAVAMAPGRTLTATLNDDVKMNLVNASGAILGSVTVGGSLSYTNSTASPVTIYVHVLGYRDCSLAAAKRHPNLLPNLPPNPCINIYGPYTVNIQR